MQPENEKDEIDLPECKWFTANFDIKSAKFLGKGSFARVYQIQNHKKKFYAIKILICTDADQLKEAKKEIEKMKKLPDHKNIIQLLDVHIESFSKNYHCCYLVTELAMENLTNFLEKRQLSILEIHNIIKQICRGLLYCHNTNIIHFDIKPDNILVFENNLIKIADFGSALTFFKLGTIPLGTKPVSTTLFYASPELEAFMRGLVPIDIETEANWGKMDVWSFGWTMLKIFGIPRENCKVIKEKPITEYSKALNELLENNFQKEKSIYKKVLANMLEYDPKHRWDMKTVKEIIDSIKLGNEGLPILIRNVFEQTATIDVVFILDITGSMDQYVEGITINLLKIVKSLKKTSNERNVRIGCIFFRDLPSKKEKIRDENNKIIDILGDIDLEGNKKENWMGPLKVMQGNPHVWFMELTENVLLIENILKTVECRYGYDKCEDSTAALKCAADMNWIWGNKFKICILITDSPCHGLRYHNPNIFDDYPEKDNDKENLEEAIRKMDILGTVLFSSILAYLYIKITYFLNSIGFLIIIF